MVVAASAVAAMAIGTQLLVADTFDRYATRIGEITHVRQTVTEVHLALEEHLGGDTGVDAGRQVLGRLDEATARCRSVLEGDGVGNGGVRPVRDPERRRLISALCDQTGELRAVGARLLASPGSHAGSSLDAEFDAIYREVLSLADESDVAVTRAIGEERTRLELLSDGGLLVLIVVAAVFLIVMFGRHRRSMEATNRALVEAGEAARHVLAESQLEAERTEILNRLSDRLTFAIGESDMVAAAVAALRRLVPSPGGDVLLINASQDRLIRAAAWGLPEAATDEPVAVDDPSLCPGIRRRSAYLLADAADDLDMKCAAHPAASGSVVCVPMLALGQTVGVIHLERPGTATIDAQGLQLAARVAEQIALGVANARLLQTMEGLAMTDALTGLHNARFFDPLLDAELAVTAREGGDLGIIMIDIDHFKELNDRYGHPAGDEALKAFARAVRNAARDSDTVARYGGEEFVMLARRSNLAGTRTLAEGIRRAVEELVIDIGPKRTARITASFGVTSAPEHGIDRLLLMRTADQALYRAKEQGRNRVVVADVVRGAAEPVTPPDADSAPTALSPRRRATR